MVAGVELHSGRYLLVHLFGLAKLYQGDIGIPQNVVAAYKWLDIRNRLLSDGSGTMTSVDTPPEL